MLLSKSFHNSPAANSTNVLTVEETVGNKADNTATIPSSTNSVISYLKGVLTKLPVITARSATTLPQSTATPYFTVTGRVIISDIVGEVTVELGGGLNNMKLTSNPTVGADVDLCAIQDVDADVVGTMYHITGTLGDALIPTTSGAFTSQISSIVVAAGTIDLYCSASRAGQTKWTLYYIPLDSGSTVTAA